MTEQARHARTGRLALRQHNGRYVAYYAAPDTMEGALEIGSIHAGTRRERREAFRAVMEAVVRDIIEDNTGRRPDDVAPLVPD